MKLKAKGFILAGVTIALLLIAARTDWLQNPSRIAESIRLTKLPGGTLSNGGDQNPHKKVKRENHGQKPQDSRLNVLFNDDDYSISSQKLEEYLRKVGRNDKSLTAAYLLSGDPLFLKELHGFPDSPLALAMIAREESGSKEAKAAAQRLAELSPDNPQGHYWLACFAAKEGDLDAAISYLCKVNELPGSLDVLGGSVTNEMLGALEALGHDKVESFAYLYHKSQWLQSYQSSTRDLSSRLAASLRDLPEEEQATRAAAVIGLFQRLKNTQQEAQPVTAMTQMANERSVLKMLPPDIGYGDSGTVADRLTTLKSLIEDESQMMELEMPALQHAKPETIDEYFSIFQNKGASAAREWLLSNY